MQFGADGISVGMDNPISDLLCRSWYVSGAVRRWTLIGVPSRTWLEGGKTHQEEGSSHDTRCYPKGLGGICLTWEAMPAGGGHIGGQEAQVVGVGGGHAAIRLARPHRPLLVDQLLQHLLHSYPLTICSQSPTHPLCSCVAGLHRLVSYFALSLRFALSATGWWAALTLSL